MQNTFKILTINPGSTSTKAAVYENGTEIYKKNIHHPLAEIQKYTVATDQSALRKHAIMSFLHEMELDPRSLSAIAARGGALPPVKTGAYRINQKMVDYLKNQPKADHASNVAAIIAYEIADELQIPAYIYDAVTVDQITDIARLSGTPELPRICITHVLNPRAMALNYAASIQRDYHDLSLIIAHLGGGISISIHHKGRIIDVLSDDEGPFSPERAGKIASVQLVDLCFSGKYDHAAARKIIRGKGGFLAYLGTNSALEVETRIADGDEYALLVYEAMAYQVAKGIGELAPVVKGQVDAIILTGGMAYSSMLTSWIKERVAFIAPVVIMPGENELEALAGGVLRVLRHEEHAHDF